MSRGVNKIILIGNLGKDPETKSFANGGSVTNVSLAVNEQWKGNDGSQQEHTEWFNLTFNDKLGEIVQKYLRKGSKVYIEGSQRTRKYQGNDGKEARFTEVRVQDMQMLDGAPGGEERSTGGTGHYSNSAPARNERPAQRQAPQPQTDQNFGGPDDDIPF